MVRVVLPLVMGLVLAALLCGCGGGGGEEPSPTVAFMPLAVGNTWSYTFTDYTEPAGIQAAAARRPRRAIFRPASVGTRQVTAEDIWEVTGTQGIGGREWFAIVAQFAGDNPSPPIFMRHDAQGLMFKGDEADPGYYLLRAPLQVGNEWTDPNDDRLRSRIAGVGETVSVPAGVFGDCIIVDEAFIEPGQPDDVITRWYARDAGLVREERHVGDTLTDKLELMSFALAP